MDPIEKLVRRAARRMTIATFLHRLSWAMFAAVSAFAVYLLMERLCYLNLPAERLAIVAVAAALAASVLLTFLARATRLHAAIALDERAGLKSRLATAVETAGDDSPMAAAAAEDAADHAGKVHLAKAVPIALPRAASLWLLPAALILVLIWAFVPQCDILHRREREIQKLAEKQEMVKRAEEVKAMARQIEKRADIQDLEIAQKLVGEMKAMAEKMQQAEDKPQALAELANLAEQLKAQRDRASEAEQLKKTLESLQGFTEGEMLKDMVNKLQQKDMKGAAQALRELQSKMQKGQMTKKEMQKLAKEMQKLAQAMKNGDPKMSEQLQEMAKNLMANQAKALENMQQLMKELKDKQKMMAEMELMDLALADLTEMKADMTGVPTVTLPAQEEGGEVGMGMGFQDKPGAGGVSEDGADTGTTMNKTRLRGQLDKGEILGSIFVRGMPKKGKALVEYSEVVKSARDDAADALSKEEIPPGYKGLIKDYFDSIDPKKIPKAEEDHKETPK
ncbi:MAG: hypothetical protein GXP25_24740 [Planctomycetes bacterium]|nr:hypothetical protein [Planctomycetota bacterium]